MVTERRHVWRSAPLPKFVMHRSNLRCELRKQRALANVLSLVPLVDFKSLNELAAGDAGTSDRRHRPGGRGMLARVKSFLVNENGATAIEYALIAAGIAAAIITTVQSLGTKVSALFSNVDSALN
jgi:pilus assembly protein Flp/PilA